MDFGRGDRVVHIFQSIVVSWRVLACISDSQDKLLRRQRSHVRIVSGAPTKSITYSQFDPPSHTAVPHSREAGCGSRSRRSPSAWVISLCLAVAGCTTTAEIAARRDAEFQALVGVSMAEFMRRTG